MKRNKIGTVGSTEKDKQSIGLVPVPPSLFYYRGTLGEPLTVLLPKFDLWDPNMHLTDWTYSSLHDPHLKRFFSQPNKKRLLIKHGLITHDEKVLCSRKEFSRYMNYIKAVQQSWEKHFVQKQKQLLKEFMLQQLRGQVPEHVTVSDMKEWLIYKGRNTFRSMYRKFMKWSDPQCAELAWELNQRFQLEDLEKEVIRELQLKRQGLLNLEVLRHSSGARPGSPVETSTEEASSLVIAQMTVENLHNYIRRITTSLTGEIKANLVPVLLEQLHDGCTKPRNSADSSSYFLPKYSSSEDMAETDAEITSMAVSCRDSISPIISLITSEESCSSSLFNLVNLSGIFSGYSTTASTDVVTFESKDQSSDSLPKVKSQSTVTDPAKFKRLAEDVCGLDMMTVIPYYGRSVSLSSPAIKTDLAEDMESPNLPSPTLSSLSSLTPVTSRVSSFEMKSDLADDIESPVSRDSRNQSPLLAEAEMVVLVVVNHSVALLKSLILVQTENGWYIDPDLQMTETDIQSADTFSKIEEIRPSLSSLSSLSSTTSLTESIESSSIIGHPSSSHISIISGDSVESSLERVIPVQQIEGHLSPLHTSEEMNESSSFKSSDSDPTSQSASSHQLSSEARRALSETLVRIQRKLSSESLMETASHENSNAIVELLNDTIRQIQASPSLHSQHQDSPVSLQCPSIMSSCPTLKHTKVQTAFEGHESKLLAQNVLSVTGIIHKTNKEQLSCPVSEDTRTAFTDLAEDVICSVPLSIAELSSDVPLAANDEFAGPSDLRNTLRKILLSSCDSTCTQSDQINEEESSRNLASSLAHVVYQYLQDKHQPEIQISKTLDEYTTTKVDCSSSEVKVISSPPSESVINLLERTFDNKAKTSNVVKSAFKQLAKPFLKMLHIQSQSDATKLTFHKLMVEELSAEGTTENSRCTIDGSDSPSSDKPMSKHYSDIVLRVVERIVTKIIMETFRLHRLSHESASLDQDFESFISSHPQHEFILWLRSYIMETVLEQLFVPQKVTDVRDATRAENPAGTLAATEEIVTEMPIMENTPVGSKPKRMKQVQAFFRRAWQAVKKTCSCGRRSNKISPL